MKYRSEMDSFHNDNEMSSAGRRPQNEYYTMSRIHCGNENENPDDENEFPGNPGRKTLTLS